MVKAYASGAVCVANNFRCKIPHVKAFFAVLTDEKNARYFLRRGARGDSAARAVDARGGGRENANITAKPIELLEYIRKNQKNLVMKPSDEYGGMGVTLGWEVEKKDWEAAMEQALPGGKLAKRMAAGSCRNASPCSRGEFPHIGKGNKVEFQNMLVDFAPYLFRGKVAGFLTRLSSTSLANVTSGGGQIPSFRVEPKRAERRASAGKSLSWPGIGRTCKIR